ncbi:MAG: hypothetical protein AAF211_16705 [Myxococcota bacterium]
MLLADRRSTEARELFLLLSRYVAKRVGAVSRHCGGALAASEREEVVSDVLLQLLQGSLATFRGATVPELLGFVRTVTDRTAWRTIRKRDRERSLLAANAVELTEDWTARLPPPDYGTEPVADSPLSPEDQAYLVRLLQAGSKAELARRAGVSRAAVTQRVQRIRNRVADLTADAQMRHEVWLSQAARRVVTEEPR